MEQPSDQIPYHELVALADRLLDECDDDAGRLAEKLEMLPESTRNELIVSDLLNALQVFFFYFRQMPDEIEAERMMLHPASELPYGIRINEIELLELIFAVTKDGPAMIVSDGEAALAVYWGRDAYTKALEYIASTL
ncbi:MAG: hypothetical protein A4E35_02194 [Methanoregula sp. PtaU1.Bin051]|nr:MAG: hypothetical protein A4E35_02194 [Methanoregula sp. PtaU1.Bin051]